MRTHTLFSASCTVLIIGIFITSPSFAQTADENTKTEVEEPEDLSKFDTADTDDTYETKIISDKPPRPALPKHRAISETTRKDMQRRLPRSAPDALRYEPGVFVQQTAHSQGSAFIRGMTGQQTLLLFDGIRLNNSTYRQGPNQYFFTLDSQTIQSIQVERGGASTRFGSDALGGVILALPMEATLKDPKIDNLITWEPHAIFRGATADHELGGRAQTNLTIGDSFAFFGGVGARRTKRLESGGIVYSPQTGEAPQIPRFELDNRTQMGTGFNEITADGRLVFRLSKQHLLKIAAYTYRQFDAPRTDQCPAAYAPYDECFKYDNQFRTLVYGAWEGEPHTPLLKSGRATVSWQNQFERRTGSRPSSNVENIGRDTVNTLGGSFTAKTQKVHPANKLDLQMSYGMDTYHDIIDSAAWISFSDISHTQKRSRGQYINGSTYTYGGAFVEGTGSLSRRLFLRAGGRISWIHAKAPTVTNDTSSALSKSWFPLVGNAGIEARITEHLHLLADVDRSYRAPNLDDLTSRQQTGPGFQFENPALNPEKTSTYEAGLRVKGPLNIEFWLFKTYIYNALVKSPRNVRDCPSGTPQCENSWSRFQLVNASDRSKIKGFEASMDGQFPGGLETRATIAWTWGDGPNMGDPPSDPSMHFDKRIPLSRIPPLNGSVELNWRHASGLSLGTTLRWAATQTRLALSDISDERIPQGGTPGFAVMDFRVNYRLRNLVFISLSLENIFDAAYRYHGSAVNGPGRGLALLLDFGPLWRL